MKQMTIVTEAENYEETRVYLHTTGLVLLCPMTVI